LYQPLAHLDRILDCVAGAFELQKGERVIVFGRADSSSANGSRADFPANRLDDLHDEPGAVFERAAVFVLAVVDGRAENCVIK
jgi:hypothetical protein